MTALQTVCYFRGKIPENLFENIHTLKIYGIT